MYKYADSTSKNVRLFEIIDCDTNVTNHVSAWGLTMLDIVINVMENLHNRVYE